MFNIKLGHLLYQNQYTILAISICKFSLLLAVLLLGLKTKVAITITLIMLVFSLGFVKDLIAPLLMPVSVFVEQYCKIIVIVQAVLYMIGYNYILPDGLYYSPDSVVYLSLSSLVPPIFGLFARGLLELELALGNTTPQLLMQFVVLTYSIGGCLIANALIKVRHPITALFVIPMIWSMNSLTVWFNYYLTDGIATAFMILTIGAYANLHFSMIDQNKDGKAIFFWFGLSIIFCALSFYVRLPFYFLLPSFLFIIVSRVIFSWGKFFGAAISLTLAVLISLSFQYYWHGEIRDSKSGATLTTLVFDFPLPFSCPNAEYSEACHIENSIKPFIEKSRSLNSQDRFFYKALNNGYVFQAMAPALLSFHNKDEHLSSFEDYLDSSIDMKKKISSSFRNYAFLKILNNKREYVSTVLKNSYYSIKGWGDRFRDDHLGIVSRVNMDGTNRQVNAIKAIQDLDFDPTMREPAPERFYKDLIFQPWLVLGNGSFVNNSVDILLILSLFFVCRPIFYKVSVPFSIMFVCCVFGLAGVIGQNALFPTIPRLLTPFQPLGGLCVLICASFIFKKLYYPKIK